MKEYSIGRNRNIVLATYQNVMDDAKRIEVELSYDAGGRSYISGNRHKRGYYLYVQPIEVQHYKRDDGSVFYTKSFVAYTGLRKFLVEAKMYSAPKLLQLASRMSKDSWAEILLTVMKQNHYDPNEWELVND